VKITKQELKQLIKEEVDFLLREAQFELGSPELKGRTGGGGRWAHWGPALSSPGLKQARVQGIEPALSKDWQAAMDASPSRSLRADYPALSKGWIKTPTSKPGGAPIQHPGLYSPGVTPPAPRDPVTGELTGEPAGPASLPTIEPPADPIEDPFAGWPSSPTKQPVPKRDDLSSLEAAIMQALMQRLG